MTSITILLLATATLAVQGTPPTMKRVESLMRSRRWAQAEEALGRITVVDESHGQVWFDLASAFHGRKDWAGAIRANEHAASFPMQRASALYNLACAQSLSGMLEEAWPSLESAVAAGFLDFDLMATDTDLEALRGKHPIPLPKPRAFLEHRARNGVEMPYLVLDGETQASQRERPVLIALAPGGKRSGDWMAEELWADLDDRSEWIVVIVAAPERGWYTHPTHHALEDLLKELKKKHSVAGDRFHLFGIASGCGPATTYSRMSGKYFQSMTLVSSAAWNNYDDSDWKGWRDLTVLQIVGSESFTLEADREVHRKLEANRVRSKLTVCPGEGLLVPSLRGDDLLAAIEEALPPQE